MQQDLSFKNNLNPQFDSPLADRLRPKVLDDFYGQEEILNPNSLLYNAIISDKVGNTIFYGPPGVGKTTLIEIISFYTRSSLIKLNAVLSGIKDLRNEICFAQERWKKSRRKTILFIDEVHRFTTVQQDALLPSIENGSITFIGATTENPFFSVNKALISRSRQFKLKTLEEKDMIKIISKVINYYFVLEKPVKVQITEEASKHLINFSSGDARNLINALEFAIDINNKNADDIIKIDLKIAEESIQRKKINYDKVGEKHFDILSAFIKSIRGSDPDATLYWLAYMLEAGEDPNLIFRRLLIAASEDIGLADPVALVIINSCREAFKNVGLPEGYYFLSHASLYLAIAPKSNSTKSIFAAIQMLNDNQIFPIPSHLKNYSTNYKNPLDHGDPAFQQSYMPQQLRGYKFWEPGNYGWEKKQSDDNTIKESRKN